MLDWVDLGFCQTQWLWASVPVSEACNFSFIRSSCSNASLYEELCQGNDTILLPCFTWEFMLRHTCSLASCWGILLSVFLLLSWIEVIGWLTKLSLSADRISILSINCSLSIPSPISEAFWTMIRYKKKKSHAMELCFTHKIILNCCTNHLQTMCIKFIWNKNELHD